jgi:hypothetical protein
LNDPNGPNDLNDPNDPNGPNDPNDPNAPNDPNVLFRCKNEVSPSILRPAALGSLTAERLFLALADGQNPVGRNSKTDEIVFHGRGASFTQGEVVFGAPSLVAVSLDVDLGVRPTSEPVNIFLQCRA